MILSSSVSRLARWWMPDGAPLLIDEVRLATLAGEVGQSLPAIMEAFRDEVRDRIIAMRQRLQRNDRRALTIEAHSIKGTASAMGLVKLSLEAKALEDGVERMSSEEIALQLRAIQSAFYDSCSALVVLRHLPALTKDDGP